MWRRLTSGVVILAYHAFGQDGDQPTKFVVQRRAFVRQLAWLRGRGFHPLSLEELLAIRRENRLPPARSVVVTIDDGYKDAVTIAQPILRRFGMPATVFAVTGRVGGVVDWTADDRLVGRALADWDDLRYLVAEGTPIEAHSRTHANLTTLSAASLDDEVAGSRDDIERELGRPASVFAYPGGRFDESVVAAVERAGFEAALTTMPRLNGPFERDLGLRRLEVYGTDSLLMFALAVRLGDASWLGRFQIRREPPPEQSPVVRPAPGSH
jgi:peptidoglycan/xylan/chitin deacetylase (PgdA/CDA1 family)